MSTGQSATDFYVAGGTMSPDADSYIERAADEELFESVKAGEYCYALTTRQMGKSSLMARTARRLAAAGVRSAQITLETIRESSAAPNPDQFLYGIASGIHRGLDLKASLSDWWRERDLLSATQRFHEYLTELPLHGCPDPIVVFIDEIDSTIGLPFADDFYATIRACYNDRASKPALNRLTFVLLGVATPAQLITDPTRTPFNIGKGIELADFTAKQAEPLSRAFPGTEERKRALLDRALYWTGGHPYLTQSLCRRLAVRLAPGNGETDPEDGNGIDAVVDAEVAQLFLRPETAREEANMKFVRSRLTQGSRDLRAVLRTYQRVLAGKRVEDKPASSIHASLKLAGVVRTDADGYLQVRNRIYAQVFGRDWVRREMPRNRGRIAMWVSAAAVLLSATYAFYSYQQARQARIQQEDIQARVREQDRTRAELLQQLVRLADDHPSVWEPGSSFVTEQFLRQVGPDVFAQAPWQDPSLDPSRLLDVIERSHRLFVPSRDTFGAMSFALEDVWLRHPSNPELRDRAQALFQTVREAFIAYHKEETPNFKEPPVRAADPLNPWVSLVPGDFEMGSEGDSDERPVHRVRVSAFDMQQHEVTNEEYQRFDPSHDLPANQARHPVRSVSWYEAAGYAAWLGASLPTEAEWEYAAAGTGAARSARKSRRYPWGGEDPTPDRAVFSTKTGDRKSSEPVIPPRVAGRTPEGIDDLAGNVWEWCRDWYGPYEKLDAPEADPLGPIAAAADKGLSNGGLRVLRGGSFYNDASDLPAAFRFGHNPDYRSVIGIRLVSSRFRP